MSQDLIDAVLGPLTFDEDLNWFEGVYNNKSGVNVPFTISLDEAEGSKEAIAEARELLPLLVSLIDAGKKFACDNLLDVKNEHWLDAGEPEVDERKFISSLEIESIGLYPDKEGGFSFADGGLFAGHVVMMSWNPEDGFSDADIAG
jgi:hypothetical protein